MVAVAAAVIFVAAGIPSESSSAAQIAAVVAVTSPAVLLGLLVVARRPDNVIGTLLVALGTVPLVVLAIEAWGATATGPTTPWPAARVLGVVSAGAYGWLYLPVVGLALLFPDGRLVSSRWWKLGVASVVVPLVVQAVAVFNPETYVAGGGTVPGRPPIDVSPGVVDAVGALSTLGLLVVLAVAMVSVVVRYRRETAAVRWQIRWFALIAPLLPGALLACVLSVVLFGAVVPLGVAALGILFAAFPTAIAVAILRHDLYDIDRLISRSLVYTTLSGLLASMFALTALAAGLVLGRGSPGATGLAAVACTLSINPLRRRVQPVIDRRFYADRRIALATVNRFVTDVRDGRAPPEQVERTLQSALGDPDLRLLCRLPGDERDDRWIDAGGREVIPPSNAGIPVGVSGEILALAVPGAATEGRRGLVAEVLREARLPVEISRLQLEVRRALEETAASRARLVQAADDERSRLQRDLHDGAQQRLVALGLDLRRVERSLGDDDPARTTLDKAVQQLQIAVGELRHIAHGLRPSALDDGLATALRALVRSCPVSVDLDLDLSDDTQLPEAVTTAAYYVAAEALANALKHANASAIDITLCHEGGSLILRIVDDGAGGAAPDRGTGLTGIADRVATFGGCLRVHSSPGAGTSVEAVLPCAS